MFVHFEIFPCVEVTEPMLLEAAAIFSDNYGIWGSGSQSSGKPVKLNPRRLREQYLSESSGSLYARVTVDEKLAGTTFACRWNKYGNAVCRVTQLVVDINYREQWPG